MIDEFQEERRASISSMAKDYSLQEDSLGLLVKSVAHGYPYHFDWFGRPIIQFPEDIVVFQEIVWEVKPDLILEVGIARGGSLVLSASMLVMLDLMEDGTVTLLPNDRSKNRQVIGVDIDIRPHNRRAIEAHPLYPRIKLIEGSSVDDSTIEQVISGVSGYNKILVCLDSNHTHDHVLRELEVYGLLTTPGSYCLVYDTVIDDMPDKMFVEREWGQGNNPKTAVREFVSKHPEFEVNKRIGDKLLMTAAPSGHLYRRVTEAD